MTDHPELHHEEAGSAHPPLLFLHGGTVAGWSWEEQVAAFSDRKVVTPDLPGFGRRARDDWPGLPGAADAVAKQLAELGITGPVDVVGLSFGGIVGLHVAARHPRLVRTLLVSGPMLAPAGIALRAAGRLQLGVWNAPWYWKAQAAAMGLPPDARDLFVRHGLTIRRDTMHRIASEIYPRGALPADISRYTGPLLGLAGARESAYFRRSLGALRRAVPQAEIRLAPGMHHMWSIEDTGLFNDVTASWLAGRVDPRLLPL
ncbi:alpha/beta fold hydrolase [Myceligenerans pegani]|uniref:Alpha/beta fold hydrolase n=1 Tax=Myceligenerans pegani TaxID=2776917 RepID=A0ABR9MZ95_9MICO|nr:alpha/beta fold hydrolase [Myceligenerans sp. TRM 65318]MBE1876707.1 alpha/beta fold hydrolase [Myceligenerans sp. TRM 65318]MBE3018978.1 alpha/beta fold hydrolase [Myceligenerans sp. TRM 65318]